MVSPLQHGRKLQAEVHAGGAATGGHSIAIDHDALLHRDGAVERQKRQTEPMRRRPIAAEQAGGAKHQRAGADGGDIVRVLRLPAQKIEPIASSRGDC